MDKAKSEAVEAELTRSIEERYEKRREDERLERREMDTLPRSPSRAQWG